MKGKVKQPPETRILLDELTRGANNNVPQAQPDSQTDVVVKSNRRSRLASRSDFTLNQLNVKGKAVLHVAARNLDLPRMTRLLDAGADVGLPDRDGLTPMHYVAQSDQAVVSSRPEAVKEAIELLVKKGGKVNAQSKYLTTPLSQAAKVGHTTCVTALLAIKDVDKEICDVRGWRPMHYAANNGSCDVAELFIAAGCDLHATTTVNLTPLHVAVSANDKQMVELLLNGFGDKQNKSINTPGRGKCTPLHLAIEKRNTDIVSMLLQHGADLAARCYPEHGHCPAVHLACMDNDTAVLDLLLREGADVLALDDRGRTALHKAVQFVRPKIIAWLNEKNLLAELLEKVDEEGCTPLLLAWSCLADKKKRDSCRILKMLIEYGADPAATDRQGRSGLHRAFQYSSLPSRDIAMLFRELQVSSEKKTEILKTADKEGNSFLHTSIRHDKFTHELIEVLLDRKQGFLLQDRWRNLAGETPFLLAASTGDIDAGECLVNLTGGSCLGDKYPDKRCFLHAAADAGQLEFMRHFCPASQKYDTRDREMKSPLHLAAESGHSDVVSALLKAGLDPDSESYDRSTPLHMACSMGQIEVIRLLLQHGAKIWKRDIFGNNALDVAIKHGHRDAAGVILDTEHWIEALRNQHKTRRGRRQTPFRSLVEQMPDLAKVVLDKCMVVGPEYAGRDAKKEIQTRYEIVDDTFCDWMEESTPENPITPFTEEGHLKDDARPYCNRPAKIVAGHPVSCMANKENEELLFHPVVLSLIRRKWRVANYFYLAFLLYYTILVGVVSAFILRRDHLFEASSNKTDCLEKVPGQAVSIAIPCLILALVIIGALVEVIQMIAERSAYFLQASNLPDWFTYVGAAILAFSAMADPCDLIEGQQQLGAFTIFMAWINLLFFLGRFPRVGIFVLMIREILNTFLNFFVIFFLFIVAFGLSLHTLLFNQKAFSTPFYGVVKAWVMMLGEMDYAGIFDFGNGDKTLFEASTYILFVCFLILMTIIIMNLLTGLAVEDISSLQIQAKLRKLVMQIDLALSIEANMPLAMLKWMDCIRGSDELHLGDEQKFSVRVRLQLQGQLAEHNIVKAALEAGNDEDPDSPSSLVQELYDLRKEFTEQLTQLRQELGLIKVDPETPKVKPDHAATPSSFLGMLRRKRKQLLHTMESFAADFGESDGEEDPGDRESDPESDAGDGEVTGFQETREAVRGLLGDKGAKL